MKIQLLITALFISIIVCAQPEEHFLSYKDGFKTEGYVDGKKLDTISAQYATLGWTNEGKMILDYGQYRDGKKELIVTDKNRLPILIESINIPFMLNFMYFNGWEVQEIVPNINQPFTDLYLLRKRRP